MNFPPDFTARTQLLLGDHFPLLMQSLEEEAPVSIRVNPAKTDVPAAWIDRVKWSETGYYLSERASFTFDPFFHAGYYYVQEAASMFLEQVVHQYINEPVVCLDICAAPGGKSTHLLSVLPEKSLLVSNEIIRSRASILKENLSKWGSPYTIIANNDSKTIGQLKHTFDLIVADMPCSGEGMFRKDQNSRSEWSVKNVYNCAARQREIMHNIWESLKPGGYFVYSTCTFNREENEENIQYILQNLDAEVLPLAVHPDWQVAPSLDERIPAYRFYPHRTRGEGFFLALLRKGEARLTPYRFKKSKQTQKQSIPKAVKEWITQSNCFDFQLENQRIKAIPQNYLELYQMLASTLHLLSGGVEMAEVKGKDLIPSQMLAMSQILDQEAFPAVELEWKDAIRLLQKESFPLPAAPLGFNRIHYKGASLGFVKNMSGRSNNLYPQEWRIRSTHVPDFSAVNPIFDL